MPNEWRMSTLKWRAQNSARSSLRAVSLAATFLLSILPFQALAQEAKGPEVRARNRLTWMRENQKGMWNIDPNEGAYLRDLAIRVKAKRALEVGTSNGYSAIWIALGMRQTGGHLWTLEIDKGRAGLARENFRAAGVESLITLNLGDALNEIPKLQGPFQVVFIDAWKQDYVRYLEMVLPLVSPGGVIVAHNTTNLRDQLGDFIRAVQSHPQLKTTFEDAGPGGFSVSVKQNHP